MLWQLDNDRAAKDTGVRNAKASAILNVVKRVTKILMNMDEAKILTRIMTKMMSGYMEEEDRKKITTTMMSIMMTLDNGEVMVKTKAGVKNMDAVPARVLEA